MEPFSVKAVLAGEPVITRNGKLVTGLTWLDVPGYNNAGRYAGVCHGGVFIWNGEGRIGVFDSPYDLFMSPVKRLCFMLVNVLTLEKSALFSSTAEAQCARQGWADTNDWILVDVKWKS